MKDLIIVCAGPIGREIYSTVQYINQEKLEHGEEPFYNILGFLSDVPIALQEMGIAEPIIGTVEDWEPSGAEVYALGLAEPHKKEQIACLLKSRGASFETIVAPFSRVPKETTLGEGCYVSAYCVSRFAKIGNFVSLLGSMVGESTIGDFSTITGFSNTTNSIIGKSVFVGTHAVLNSVKVGNDAFICAGSVVLTNVKAGTKVLGNPAKKVDWL